MAVDAVVGKVVEIALDKLIEVAQIIHDCKESGKELETKLPGLQFDIDKIIQLTVSNPDASPTEIQEYRHLQADIAEGFNLVKKVLNLRSFGWWSKLRYGKKIQKLEGKLRKFRDCHGKLHRIVFEKTTEKSLGSIQSQFGKSDEHLVCIENLVGKNDEHIERLENQVVNLTDILTSDPYKNSLMLQQMDRQVFDTRNDPEIDDVNAQQFVRSTCQVPEMPNEFKVGLDNPVRDVRKLLLQNGISIVGITGIGGIGKTTLAASVCKDTEVKDFFQKNVFLTNVSKDPNVMALLETIWDEVIGGPRRPFRNIKDARLQLQNNLERTAKTRSRPILIVLDDVWSKSNLDDLLFEAEGYKTIFTTREEFPYPVGEVTRREYKMPMLEDGHAVSLLCFSAFGKPSIPETAEEDLEDLVGQVAAECKGLPLALKVTGSCLINAGQRTWERARKKLSKAESISPNHDEQVFKRLQMSIDILDDELKECFLDLGAFPEGRKFKADYLLDIWVYVRGMKPEDAYTNLLELAKRNLLNISIDTGIGASELCFSQHDMMRVLALRLGRQDGKRIFMPCKADNISTDSLNNLTNQSSGAQFLSFHTGPMAEQDWCKIDFPEVEALALFFAGSKSKYCLPTFLHTMPKLKVVFVYNYGPKRVIVQGPPCFPSFTQIKSVLLEGLTVSPFNEDCKSWESLEKLYLCLCEGLGNMTLRYNQQVLKFPKIVEVNLDHCSDLEELPGQICKLTSLQRLSVTNCHLIRKLPDDLGELRSLEAVRFYACTSLSMLPLTICKLQQLNSLDISLCTSLKVLPMEFGKLSKLRKLDMRECSRLKTLPTGLAKLSSLKRVICDKNIEGKWLDIKTPALPNLKIDVAEEHFSLDWLGD